MSKNILKYENDVYVINFFVNKDDNSNEIMLIDYDEQEDEKGIEENEEKSIEERKFVIDAYIMKILKQKKVMKKLVLTFAVIFATITAANAQLFIGGNLGLGVSSLGKSETTTGSSTTTVDPINTFSFNIAPKIGYNLNDKMAVGLNLYFGLNNTKYPDGYNMNETDHKLSYTNFGFDLFFRYYAMEVGQFSLFAEATAGLAIGNGSEEYKIGNTTTSIDKPKTTDIYVGITPGISYKVNEKLQFDAYLGLCELSFNHIMTKTETNNTKTTKSDNIFNLGINQHTNGSLIKIGVVYNF